MRFARANSTHLGPWPPGIGDPNGPLQPLPGGNPLRDLPRRRADDAPSHPGVEPSPSGHPGTSDPDVGKPIAPRPPNAD